MRRVTIQVLGRLLNRIIWPGILTCLMGMPLAVSAVSSVENSYRIFYFFDPALQEHIVRAQTVSELAKNTGVKLVGVVEDVDGVLLHKLTVPILTRQNVREKEEAMMMLADHWLQSESDVLLMQDYRFGNTIRVPTNDFEFVTNRLMTTGSGAVITEVDITTWGKVKDLFD